MVEQNQLPIITPNVKNAYLTQSQYQKMHQHSLEKPDDFWAEQARKFISWMKLPTKTRVGDFNNLPIKWFIDGKLNACYNCVDRHLPKFANRIALIWQGDAIEQTQKITYVQLHEQICRFANVLKKYDLKKGDRVCIYLPMIPQAVIAMLACARIGAVHSVVFAGFSPESLKNRILDSNCKIVITADEGVRGQKIIPLKNNVDQAIADCPNVEKVIVVQRTGHEISWNTKKDKWYHEEMINVSSECPCEEMDADDPLFILYTSGSTGKPKGILHTTGGYLVYVAMTFHYIFNYQPEEIYWCTADVGWITGHSYSVYGPLCNAATNLIYEGVPHHPSPARFWEIIDQFQVNIFYTAPTAIRALRQQGDNWLQTTNRNSLKILGTVGEPINPEVWEWYFKIVGKEKCYIVDTWWQTETGGILISPIPGITPLKPGSAAWPFFGINASVVDDEGNIVAAKQMGKLVINQPWPGMMKTVYQDEKRFIDNYFKIFPGKYFSGDEAKIDEENYFWITGRCDDVIKISGHRIGAGEVESALLEHEDVAEAAVVAIPHVIKGETIYAYVTLKSDKQPSENLKAVLINQVKSSIGATAIIEKIHWTPSLPKTRSGKIMRRLLRKIAANELDQLGDISTLTDPSVVDALIQSRN